MEVKLSKTIKAMLADPVARQQLSAAMDKGSGSQGQSTVKFGNTTYTVTVGPPKVKREE